MEIKLNKKLHKSLNPLKSGQNCNKIIKIGEDKKEKLVSIPLNRVRIATTNIGLYKEINELMGLNPLKSGQNCNLDLTTINGVVEIAWSQSP